jgi:hypothetical protein
VQLADDVRNEGDAVLTGRGLLEDSDPHDFFGKWNWGSTRFSLSLQEP